MVSKTGEIISTLEGFLRPDLASFRWPFGLGQTRCGQGIVKITSRVAIAATAIPQSDNADYFAGVYPKL